MGPAHFHLHWETRITHLTLWGTTQDSLVIKGLLEGLKVMWDSEAEEMLKGQSRLERLCEKVGPQFSFESQQDLEQGTGHFRPGK